ncbi:murein biosynthesis integral membrane protein MurJ [Cellulomonas chengniuliangii]|uniref:Virulence factor MviN n=1 Tax=Cellulomonas chengniuliangii TaxID=2968084 RepID=A0ABY5L2T6_9CELL|nr:lipid II flippase MurJ [Cellulomonas chengniuliangii]MCC2308713.1 virulence factor MviN [Cellulomonas chengniuliangii]UUI76969.1 virulence factor MviN [Cellulomonas chengniuliangii]
MSTRRALGGLASAAAMIAAITVLSRLLGFGRWFVQAGAVGPGLIGGAYNTANTLPNVLFEVAAGGALAGALIPVVTAPLRRGDRAEVNRTASALLGWTLLVLVPLAGALALAAGPLARLFAGLTDDPVQPELIRYFILVFAAQIPLYGLGVVLSGLLQAQRRFFWPALAPALSTAVVIVAYAVYGQLADGQVNDASALPPGALAWLAWGTTAGVAAMSLPLLIPVLRSGVRFRPTLSFPPGVAARVRSLAFAGIGALLAQQASVVAMLLLAGGRVWSVFLYAQAVYLLPYAVLAVPLATSTFPRLAERAARPARRGFAEMAALTTRAVLVAAGVGVAALVAAAPAVAELFASIVHPEESELVLAMGPALTWMAPGLVGFALLFHVARALYALEHGRAAVVAAVWGWSAVAVTAALLAWLWAPPHDGPRMLVALGAANTAGMLVAAVALLAALRKVAGAGALQGAPRTLVVLTGGVLVGAAAGRWTTDQALAIFDSGWASALGAGAGGGALAIVLVTVAVAGLDRGTLRGVLGLDRGATPLSVRDHQGEAP